MIDVTESSNHSKRHYIKLLEPCDCVIGKKATFWGDIGVRVDTIRSIDLICRD